MFLYPLWVSGAPPHSRVGETPKVPVVQPVAPTHLDRHNQERFLEKFSPSPGHPALPPAGRVSHGFVQQQTLTLVHRDWGGGTWGGRWLPRRVGEGEGELRGGKRDKVGGWASAEVLAPREAHWRPPGKKGLVLTEERGGEQRIHSKAQAGLRVPREGSPRSSSGGKGGNQVLG